MWSSAAALDVASLACWFLIPLFQLVVGVAMASVVLPATRIYAPLERTTGELTALVGCGGKPASRAHGLASCPRGRLACAPGGTAARRRGVRHDMHST